MRAHCVNAERGALWLSEHHGDPGSALKLDTSDFGGDVVHLGEYEVCLLAEACDDWLREHARTDRGLSRAESAAPPGAKPSNQEAVGGSPSGEAALTREDYDTLIQAVEVLRQDVLPGRALQAYYDELLSRLRAALAGQDADA